MIGISPKIEKIRQQIRHAADNKTNTIIFGESGVGKELVAQTLFSAASTKGKRFIKVNCELLSMKGKEWSVPEPDKGLFCSVSGFWLW